jgi:L-lysine 2,3-aminomutase
LDNQRIIDLPWLEDEWQKKLHEAVSDPKELLTLLELDPRLLSQMSIAAQQFKLCVPHSFIMRMQKNDLNDPLLMQVLPIGKEFVSPKNYLNDPLGEQSKNFLPGLLHKYSNRILLVPSVACAVHCRYCFRRNFNYQDNNPGRKGRAQIFDYIRQHSEITEVILSGGDPLTANDRYLSEYIQNIVEIPHVKRLRVHTRFPIVLPERITQGLLKVFQTRLKTVFVLHSNHPNEIDASVAVAVRALQHAGIVVFNQSVLLKGVNDSSRTLTMLSEKLFEVGVIPYYLHVLDKVKGAAHFAVSRKRAKEIMQELLIHLPGYLIPKLVVEEAGKPSKTPIL